MPDWIPKLTGGPFPEPKWSPGDRVYWRDRTTVWTVQPGDCTAGEQFFLITAPGLSAVAWQDELVRVPASTPNRGSDPAA